MEQSLTTLVRVRGDVQTVSRAESIHTLISEPRCIILLPNLFSAHPVRPVASDELVGFEVKCPWGVKVRVTDGHSALPPERRIEAAATAAEFWARHSDISRCAYRDDRSYCGQWCQIGAPLIPFVSNMTGLYYYNGIEEQHRKCWCENPYRAYQAGKQVYWKRHHGKNGGRIDLTGDGHWKCMYCLATLHVDKYARRHSYRR